MAMKDEELIQLLRTDSGHRSGYNLSPEDEKRMMKLLEKSANTRKQVSTTERVRDEHAN